MRHEVEVVLSGRPSGRRDPLLCGRQYLDRLVNQLFSNAGLLPSSSRLSMSLLRHLRRVPFHERRLRQSASADRVLRRGIVLVEGIFFVSQETDICVVVIGTLFTYVLAEVIVMLVANLTR